MKVQRALISVSDKTGIVEFATELQNLGIEILSTGGTAKTLQEAGIRVTEVSDFTGFPEMMEGRIKTLHPKIHGGLLAKRDSEDHMKQAEENGIKMIDMVVINLYPFEKTISKDGVTEEEAIEQIDIGGPSMLRSAAKNWQHVAAVTAIKDYKMVLDALKNGGISKEMRRTLAIKVFTKTSYYDQKISEYLKTRGGGVELLNLHYEKVQSLRYGENPHQKAVFFRDPHNHYPNVTNAKQIQGKELSFNNIVDADGALELVKDFEKPTAAVIKHTNPCGVASADDISKALKVAHQVDPMSAFGCVMALNRDCTREIAEYIRDNKLFVELIICPGFEEDALEVLGKRKNLRLLETGKLRLNPVERDIKTVSGGILVQNADQYVVGKDDLKTVTKVEPSEEQIEAMLFARKVVKHVKSNSVVFAKIEEGVAVTTGIGAGQMSRVDAVHIATHKGGDRIKGSVLASDAFFPFSDGVEEAVEAGVTAIIQPGGSIRDEEVFKRADELGIAMVVTGVRSFKH
ncbi:MAG: bifunctional phosphoribosylaminoimidazolecarboxamide formyltransferase/IMP cyclohydrolase [Patescibacteria group bacterium]|nr:bifunctional phosphoribosylaminoimidazolecarboxamide formyltransferase/IMP cyclohydrolase [Patescibacteria group bacterium]